MSKLPGYRQINGSWGRLWWGGDQVFEVESFELKVTPNREEIKQAGSLDVDSKITSIKCEGSFKVKKVYSRGINSLLKDWKNGRDPRTQLTATLDDPDAFGAERVVIDNVWFNEMTLMQFELGTKLEREFTFGCTISDIDFPETIRK